VIQKKIRNFRIILKVITKANYSSFMLKISINVILVIILLGINKNNSIIIKDVFRKMELELFS
jgi:hypothetical protein